MNTMTGGAVDQQKKQQRPCVSVASVVAVVAMTITLSVVIGCCGKQQQQHGSTTIAHDRSAAVAMKNVAVTTTGAAQMTSTTTAINATTLDVARNMMDEDHRRRRETESTPTSGAEDLKALLVHKMTTPRDLVTTADDGASPKQFLHLHHMKTAGTSMDRKLQCALNRLRKTTSSKIAYYSLHECSHSHYQRCKSGADTSCINRMNTSAIISYCAPLKDLPIFGWDAYTQPEINRNLEVEESSTGTAVEDEEDEEEDDVRKPIPEDTTIEIEEVERLPIPQEEKLEAQVYVEGEEDYQLGPEAATEQGDETERMPIPEVEGNDAAASVVAPYGSITVLRHPVDRVWSMFRFQTRNCYGCRNLTDIYHSFETGVGNEKVDQLCLRQLMNHETANLLSSSDSGDPSQSTSLTQSQQDSMIQEAIYNMQHFFTIIGLTEQLPKTVSLVDAVFPWMAESVADSDIQCPLPHANSSPSNNRCGPNYSHWDLPDEPDEVTRAMILKYNALDMKLYEAAVELFDLQWEVYEEGIGK